MSEQRSDKSPFAEQEIAKLLYEQAFVSNCSVILIAWVFYFLLIDRTDTLVLKSWAIILSLAALYRLWLYRLRLKLPDYYSPKVWTRRYVFGSALAGCSWSVVYPLVYTSQDPLVLIALSILAFGAISSAVPVLAASLPAFLSYAYPQAFVFTLSLTWFHQTMYYWLAFVVCIYLVLSTFFIRNANRSLDRIIRLQSQNASLIKTLNREVEQRQLLIDEGIRELKQTNKNLTVEIKERKQVEAQLQVSSLVYQIGSEAMAVTNAKGQIMSINSAFTTSTGYTLEEVFGKGPAMLQPGFEERGVFKMLVENPTAKSRWVGETWLRRKEGDRCSIWLSLTPALHENGKLYRWVVLFSDITEKKEAEKLILHQANFDSLTGCANRHRFMEQLKEQIDIAHTRRRQIALMFLDLDHFKEVNDTLGHVQGDRLLSEAAHRITSCVRTNDLVSRLGGDEFTVVVVDFGDIIAIENLARKMLEALEQPFNLEGERVYISASIGITLYPDDASAIDALLVNADQAMYAAKAEGRGRFHYFTPSMRDHARLRKELLDDLRGALTQNQFELHYQPIIALDTNELYKAEALIRWRHPQRGLVSPGEFIPLAEETGMIIEIGDWVFKQAIEDTLNWHKAGFTNLQMSINSSPIQYQDERNQPETWIEQLKALGMQSNAVAVEITEGLLMDMSETVEEKLLAFRDANIQVVLDDFGTGYSSLSYLKRFDIDYLKIDQAFVKSLEVDSEDLALCEAIIVMAHKLNIKVIAEGIETQEQCDLLTAARCDYGQGYLFSRPVCAEEFEKLLRAPRNIVIH